ncbi:Eco57I restriction-modification methylase domain-containing protein [Haloparvum sp. PAK95]|uniref:Eco57I restriction-modification methylase domain-containing protein n=1 Tax=Haloparvum sp. PAK95 TaxID=3418962 RepID=UPI003D2F1503
MSTKGIQTEFDFSEFETEVSVEDENRIIETVADSIEQLRDQIDDDTLEEIFRSDAGRYTMRADFTRDQLDPEPLTKSRVIEPILESLGYDDYGYEAGGFSDERGEQADYAVSLRNVDGIDSSRLLIEAEPVNKVLEDRGHGIDQVKSWLSQREFQSDFGFATDGIRWVFVRYDPDSYSHNIIERVDLRPIFLTLFENATAVNPEAPASIVTDDQRKLISKLVRTFNYRNLVSIVGDAPTVLDEKKEAITEEFYEDYIQIVFGVSEESDERRARSLIGEGGIDSPDEANGDDVRLFAVELMNRLIFVKFLEDKRIVRPDLLDTLVETYEEGVYTQSFYRSFLDPLFYDVFNEKPERDPQIESIDVFSEIPYLNGGLFRPELNGSSTINERKFDVSDSVLESIIDLLERYRFSTDGGPTDIDPSVLGSVFEKTINYLSTDPGDQNKELGAYYTPSEITRFCAEETVRPALLDRFKTVLQEKRDWPEAELRQYESLYELIDGVPGSGDLITLLLSEIDEFYVIDPSMGSGHFLTSVVEEIVNIRQSLYVRQEPEDYPSRHRLKKSTIQNNIYGVDIMEPAVEIGKLRLWLSIISELREEDSDELDLEEIALPNIGFNVQQGNSLIGYVDFPEETKEGNQTFERFNENSVRDRYNEIIDQIELYEDSSAFPEKAEKHRKKAKNLQEKYRKSLDKDFLQEFQAAVSDATEADLSDQRPFHWMLEFPSVYADGGFDVIVGNPPWDVISSNREEFFSRYDEQFRSYGPDEKTQVETELLEQDSISEDYERYQRNFELRAEYFNNSPDYRLQSSIVAGNTMSRENDLSVLFLERIFSLTRKDGYVAQILPGFIFNGGATKNLRMHLLENTSMERLVMLENNGIFPGLHRQAKFGVIVFRNSGSTDQLKGKFVRGDTEIFKSINTEAVTIPDDVLEQFSPEARSFPYVESEKQIDILRKVIQYPPISDENNSWYVHPYRELDVSKDADRYIEDPSEGDYPIYGGSNMYQYTYTTDFIEGVDPIDMWGISEEKDPDRSAKHRIREKTFRSRDPMVGPKKAIYNKFEGTGSQKGFVNDLLNEHRGEPLSLEDVKLDCTEYRLGFRKITQSTNERTIVTAAVPKGVVCHESLTTIRPYKIDPTEDDLSESPLHGIYERIFSDEELFVALGLLNSLPFDYLMRTKTEENVVIYKLVEAQAPHLTEGDDWFEFIWRRSARLNCYGEPFKEMRERLDDIEPETDEEKRIELQAEIDAASFHAYGLDHDETEFVLNDFYQVQNPRMMTDDYFDMVLDKYDELDD